MNLVYFNIFFESSRIHGTDCEQLDKISTKEIVLVLDGIREPHVEEIPSLLRQEALEELLAAGTQDVDVNTFGHQLLGELLHQLHNPRNLRREQIISRTNL